MRWLLIVAAILSCIVSAAYAWPLSGDYSSLSYAFCRSISLAGVPGFLIAALVSMALGWAHSSGPLGMILLIATPANSLLYFGLGVAVQKLVRSWNQGAPGVTGEFSRGC